jgi:Uma2 family endonuclease
MQLADLDLNKIYTYADYLKWQLEQRVELIKGHIYKMSAPNFAHQAIVGELYLKLGVFLHKQACRVFVAPFDVRLPNKSTDNNQIYTVVQPDICVVCDKEKYDFKGCIGAPDIVVEVLSPGNNEKDIRDKFKIYEDAGVREYWIVSPQDSTFLVYILVDGRYTGSRPMVPGDIITTPILPGFTLDLKELFESMSY